MKNKNSDIELLSAYVDGELSAAEKKYIEAKIKSSLELQKELSDLKKLKDLTANSYDQISESPFFETRLFANLNSDSKSKFNIKKWIPISALTLLTLALMAVLKFNPNLIDNLIKQQESNLVGFYKENLRPLLYAADLTNEDIFNFAVNQELPLDNTNNQILKLGYDVKGKEYFEIKKAKQITETNNLQKFVAALDFDKDETKKIDSIINSYSNQISALVLVNDKNAVAINPNIWNTRKLILADILAFAEKHASPNFNKMIPNQVMQFDDHSVAKWVNKAKSTRDDQYIFCTPDSIFTENFVFDMSEFEKNMEKMTENLTELNEQKGVLREYHFKVDSSNNRAKKDANWTKQFQVSVDTNLIKVSIQNFAVDIPEFNIPNFDSIANVILEATQNVRSVRPPAPPITVGNNSYNYDYNTVIPKKKGRTDIDLDSLMHQKNIQNEKNRIEQKERAKNDSLILMQNQELKNEMDKLRKELQKFREEIKDPQMKSNDGAIKKDTSNDADIFEI
ncbi:MAG TPA: zf-HC2 domain-containing protein [Ignavibacteriaceae bacterium]